MTESSVLDVAAAVLDPNARTTLDVMRRMDQRDHSVQEVYWVLRERFGDTVTMRLVERTLDRLTAAGVVARRAWVIDGTSEEIVGYGVKWLN